MRSIMVKVTRTYAVDDGVTTDDFESHVRKTLDLVEGEWLKLEGGIQYQPLPEYELMVVDKGDGE